MLSNSQPWQKSPLVVFDLETTGISWAKDRIVTATLAQISPTKLGSELLWEKNWLINPGIPIPESAQKIHGISTAHAEQCGRPAAEAVGEICQSLAQIRDPLVAYNAVYDLSLLAAETRRWNLSVNLESLVVLDPLVCDRRLDRYRPGKRRLSLVCQHYGVSLREAHTARADAVAAGELMYRLGEIFDLDPDPKALFEQQKQWRKSWAKDLEEYLIRSGQNREIEREWPICS